MSNRMTMDPPVVGPPESWRHVTTIPGGAEIERISTKKSWSQKAGCFVARHPAVVFGAAATIGVVLGWFVKRR